MWCAADMPGFEVFKIHPAVSIRMRVREKLHENIRLLPLLRRKCRCFLRSRNKQIYRCDRLIRVPDATKGILHSENGGYLLFLACISLVQKFYHSSAKFASGKTEIHSRSVRISTISADFSSCAGWICCKIASWIHNSAGSAVRVEGQTRRRFYGKTRRKHP